MAGEKNQDGADNTEKKQVSEKKSEVARTEANSGLPEHNEKVISGWRHLNSGLGKDVPITLVDGDRVVAQRTGSPQPRDMSKDDASKTVAEKKEEFRGKTGDVYHGPKPEFATNLAETAINYPNVNFKLPDNIPQTTEILPNTNDKFWEFFGGNSTADELRKSKEPNPYAAATKDTEPLLRDAIMKSDGNLAPADVMKLSLDACGGNYPLAVLTAHNLLKEVCKHGREDGAKLDALASRNKLDPANPEHKQLIDRYGSDADLANKLVNMREAPGDKMGPWYHAFAVLGMQAVTDSARKAQMMTDGEQLMRTGNYYKKGESESPVDPEKRKSDWNFVTAAHDIQVNNHEVTGRIAKYVPGVSDVPYYAYQLWDMFQDKVKEVENTDMSFF